MADRLRDATSPYLLQHADNPVDWWQWGEEAFAEARRRDVPVLLSVGYSACHWCHVMAHESFEDPATAQLVNDLVVPVKVDREERPDVDAVYMTATQAMTGQGCWPSDMTCSAGGSAARPSSRRQRCWSFCSGHPSGRLPLRNQRLWRLQLGRANSRWRIRRLRWPQERQRRWPGAASTTSWAAASPGTASTRRGLCPISRRCSTTTRSSPGSMRTGGGGRAGNWRAGSPSRPATG